MQIDDGEGEISRGGCGMLSQVHSVVSIRMRTSAIRNRGVVLPCGCDAAF